MCYFGYYLYVRPIISKTIAFLYTHVHYNIVGNDVKVMSRNIYGRGVKGQGYISNMKMYNILYVLAIISKSIDILYTHVHSDIVGIDVRMTL